MKIKIYIFFFFFSILFTRTISSQQSGWVWQNPLPQGNDLTSVFFVNDQTGYTAGNYGTILKTTNSGVNWIIQNSDTLNYFYSIFFIDAYTGFTCSSNISRTTNGGLTWIKTFYDTTAPIYSIYFPDANTGYALISNCNGTKIIKTTNTGINWSYQFNSSSILGNSIYFVNNTTGFTVGSNCPNPTDTGYVLKTINGGVSWDIQIFYHDYFKSIFFINQNTGFTIGGRLYKTTNTGVNWFNISTNGGASIFFTSENTGYSIDNMFYMLNKTTNGGYNWSLELQNYGGLNSIFFPNITTGFIVGKNGEIWRTIDNGLNWYRQDTSIINYDLHSIVFTDSLTGFAGGYYGIIKTTNGGLNWIEKYHNDYYDFISLFFINPNTGYAGCDAEAIFKTTDGGDNWFAQLIPVSRPWNIYFLNENTGYAAGKYGSVHKTTNAGSNWIDLSLNQGYISFESIYFTDVNNGYAAIENGCILKTTNGAMKWDTMYNGTYNNRLYAICFTSPSIGYAGGTFNILKTTNSGINWSTNYSITDEIWSFKFINENTGYALGFGGHVYKTTNAGNNWLVNFTGTGYLYSMYFTSQNTGYVVGTFGRILKTTTGGEPIGIKKISNNIPTKFILFQNYPNPFNPKTIINYQLPINSDVKLVIYDILGREVTNLVNEKQNAGTYHVEWDGTKFASGVYFYQLRVGDPEPSSGFVFSNTKKLVLLK